MGRKKKASVVLLTSAILLGACQSSTRKNDTKGNEQVIVVDQKAKQLASFKTMSSDELLKDSIEMPYFEGYEFLPSKLNDNGILFGELINEKDRNDVYVASLNLEAKTYKKLKKIRIDEGNVRSGIQAVSNDYIVITDMSTDTNLYTYYLYDLKTDKHEKIYESQGNGLVVNSTGIIHDNNLYMNFEKDAYTSNFYKYDIKNKQLKLLGDIISYSPVIADSKMYYIKTDMEKQIDYFYVYDLKTNERKKLIERTESEGRIEYLESDGKDIYLFTQQYLSNAICHKYDIKENKILPYFEISNIFSPVIFGDFMMFKGDKRNEDRNRSSEYLFDMAKEINYVYDHGSMYISKKGIVWNKFVKDERKIGKGETFKKGNSVLMYLPSKK